MKIGVIGDQHFKDNLSYADYISDRRVAEKKKILDFVVDSFKDCSHIVLMGDNFNSKNNSSETVREFVQFIERFGNKQVYIIAGNHEKKGDGRTAIDFLAEVNKPNWHVFSKPGGDDISLGSGIIRLYFIPFMLKSELGVESDKEAADVIMKNYVGSGADIIFAHHAISGTSMGNMMTDTMNEIVLPKEDLEKRSSLIMAGHIHSPGEYGKTIVTGNLFTNAMGETDKFIYKISPDLSVEKLTVPGRHILSVENPTVEGLSSMNPYSIVKVVLTDKSISVEDIKEAVKRFDASLIVEDYPSERKKVNIEGGALDLSIENLLKIYAKEKDLPYELILEAYNSIK